MVLGTEKIRKGNGKAEGDVWWAVPRTELQIVGAKFEVYVIMFGTLEIPWVAFSVPTGGKMGRISEYESLKLKLLESRIYVILSFYLPDLT